MDTSSLLTTQASDPQSSTRWRCWATSSWSDTCGRWQQVYYQSFLFVSVKLSCNKSWRQVKYYNFHFTFLSYRDMKNWGEKKGKPSRHQKTTMALFSSAECLWTLCAQKCIFNYWSTKRDDEESNDPNISQFVWNVAVPSPDRAGCQELGRISATTGTLWRKQEDPHVGVSSVAPAQMTNIILLLHTLVAVK